MLPLAHNLPLACPGLQGYLLHGGKFVLSNSTRSEDIFALIERHRVTHIAVVPALLIRLINDPSIGKFDLSSLRVIQSGGQRLQPEVRRRTKELIPSVTVQENFGMAEGMLMFVRFDDPEEVRHGNRRQAAQSRTMKCDWSTTTTTKSRREKSANCSPADRTRCAVISACRNTTPEHLPPTASTAPAI